MKTNLWIMSIVVLVLGFTQAALAVPTPEFTIAANPASVQMQGGTATSEISASSSNGYSGSIPLSCLGLPQNMTCTFTPASLQFQNGEASSQLSLSFVQGDLTKKASMLGSAGWIMSLVLISILGGIASWHGPKVASKAALLVLLPGLMLLGGCQGLQATHTQTYTITVSGTVDGVTESTPIVVTVQQ